jgi:hypothetical protein
MAPHCMMLCIWRERNFLNFEDCERTAVVLKDIVQDYGCMVCTNIFRFANFAEFLDLCSLSSP